MNCNTTHYRANSSSVPGDPTARAIERQFEQKLTGVLSYIDGVMVAVTATVDTTRQRIQTTKNLPTGDGTVVVPKKESSTSQTEGQASSGAEPGVRSNVFADINAGGGKAGKSEQKQEETEYTSAIGVERKEIDDPRGMPIRLAATITVPRGFIIGLLRKEAPAAAGAGGAGGGGGAAPPAPTEKEIQDRFDKEKVGITQAAQVHLKTIGADGVEKPGDVAVLLASGEGMGGGGADLGSPTIWRGAGAGGGGGNGGSSVSGSLESIGRTLSLGGGVVDRLVLGALAVVAVGMMLMMVRKAGRRSDMPSAEELVGLPPALDAKSDLVGEADETETAMAGIEVGEEEIKATKMRESVSEFIKKNPDSASKLLNRWIAVEH